MNSLWGRRLNDTVLKLKPSGIRQFFDLVANRPGCISLGVGEPDFITPMPILERAIEALREGYTHYTANQGLLSLREAISNYLENEYNLSYDPKTEILITVGVSEALDLALRATLKPKELVFYPEPSYVSYEPMILLAGGTPYPYYLKAEKAFRPNFQELFSLKNPAKKILMVNYPANPTGISFHEQELEEIQKLATKLDLLVISDEIYAELTYEKKHIPIATLPEMKERTLLLGGFSKAFAMTGWRVGYACGPQEIIQAMTKIHQFSMLCAPTISQIAAEAALRFAIEDRDRMKAAYKQRRDVIVEGFQNMGLFCPTPEGAFYVFVDIRPTELSSMEFATKLLEEENVAVVPGTAFGKSGEGFIRCSYATNLEEIRVALSRINRFVNKQKTKKKHEELLSK